MLITICLGVTGFVLPITASVWTAWCQALKQEQLKLTVISNRMLLKTFNTLNLTRNILDVLQSSSVKATCTQDHVHHMLLQRIENSGIALVAWYKNGIEKCSGYELAPKIKMMRKKPDFILSDGLEFSLNAKPFSDLPTTLIAFRKRGPYDVFINPNELTDIVLSQDNQIAMTYNNTILSSQNNPSPAFIRGLLASEPLKKDHPDKFIALQPGQPVPMLLTQKMSDNRIFYYDNRFVSVRQLGSFFFIATEPYANVYTTFKSLIGIFLAFGLTIAFLIMWLIVYYFKKRLSFRGELEDAIKNKEFILHYQPIINCRDNTCTGAEALVRWQRPDGQMIRPDLFIPFAEDRGLIPRITDNMIEIVFREMEDFLVENRSLHISINVASSDIHSGRIIQVLESKIAKSNIDRSQIWIELTDRSFIDHNIAKKTLQKAHELGYVLLIDDFGTGYSSLSYLEELPIDFLKIDKTFINSIGMEYVTSHVINAIINMARQLNLKLIAEGVERKDQYDFLKKFKVDFIQGYILQAT